MNRKNQPKHLKVAAHSRRVQCFSRRADILSMWLAARSDLGSFKSQAADLEAVSHVGVLIM